MKAVARTARTGTRMFIEPSSYIKQNKKENFGKSDRFQA